MNLFVFVLQRIKIWVWTKLVCLEGALLLIAKTQYNWHLSKRGKSKKGSKGGAAVDAPEASILSKEVRSTTVVGANILKEGADPKGMADLEYSVWLDKHPPLSKLRRKNIQTLSYADLKRFVKLDTRARIGKQLYQDQELM